MGCVPTCRGEPMFLTLRILFHVIRAHMAQIIILVMYILMKNTSIKNLDTGNTKYSRYHKIEEHRY